MPTPTAALRAGFDYVRRNPLSLLTVAREAARLRLVVPLELLRWGLGRIRSDKVGDFTVASDAPGIGIGLKASVMGASLRVGGTVTIDEVQIAPDTLRIALRLTGLSLDPVDPASAGPIKALLSSGAIDLSKPGNLVAFLPKKPALLVDADGDRLVLDLMKLRSLRDNPKVARVLGLLAPVLSIRELETQGDDLMVGLKIHPAGLPILLAALRS